MQCLAIMHQSTNLLCGRRKLTGTDNHVSCVGSCQVMADGANTTQTLDQYRGLPIGSALDEFFETPELRYVQTRLPDVTVFSLQQGDFAVPFNTCKGLNDDTLHVLRVSCCFQC